jgi:hypothetical protein
MGRYSEVLRKPKMGKYIPRNFDGFVKSDLTPLTPSLSPQNTGGRAVVSGRDFAIVLVY